MKTALIVAMTKNRVIGRDNAMPWHIPADLKLFKEKTTGHIVVMGRKTYESIGKPLPNRENFVISRTVKGIEGCRVFESVVECIEAAAEYGKTLFFIGGEQVYDEVVNLVDELHISHIKDDVEGDTYFPEFSLDGWKVAEKRDFPEFTYKRYVRL